MIPPARPRRSKTAGPSSATIPPAPASRESVPPRFTARLVPLDPGFYVFSLAAETGWREPVAGFALPAVHICAPPHRDGAVEIIDSFGRAGSWLGDRHKMLFARVPTGGGAALVTAYLAPDPSSPLDLEIRRIGAAGPAVAPVMTLSLGGQAAATQRAGLEVVAHIRGRGDVRFVDAPWIGRLGPGLWIEAFTVRPHDPSAAAAIEYKGLTVDGAETPWLASGSPCGTQGRGLPLIGFAVRQKAVPGGALFDCEYTGYFQSGAIAGPARNGAPCRSAIDNDPLEGMQLRITPRPGRPASAKTR